MNPEVRTQRSRTSSFARDILRISLPAAIYSLLYASVQRLYLPPDEYSPHYSSDIFVCMRFSRYVVDNKSHYFASERSRSRASFAHGYSSNILPAWWIQAYACKHATLSFLSRLSCPTHYQMEMERFELLTPCLQGRCSPNWATPPLGNWFYSIYHRLNKLLNQWA